MSNRPRLVLHVGLPKTGTSSVQVGLELNRDRLSKLNVAMPLPHPLERHPKHRVLAQTLLGVESALRELANLLTRVDGDVLMSNEGVTNHSHLITKESAAGFREIVSRHEVIVILVTREPRAWLSSYWAHAAINPPVDERYASGRDRAQLAELPSVSVMMDHSALVSRLEDLIRPRHIHITPYESGRIWDDLCSVIGVDTSMLLRPPTGVNRSCSARVVELIVRLNRLALSADARGAVIARLSSEFPQDADALWPYADQGSNIDDETYERIRGSIGN